MPTPNINICLMPSGSVLKASLCVGQFFFFVDKNKPLKLRYEKWELIRYFIIRFNDKL